MTQQKQWTPATYQIFSYTMYEGEEMRHRVGLARDEAGVKQAIEDYKKSMGETYGGLIVASSAIVRYEVWKCPGWVKELNL